MGAPATASPWLLMIRELVSHDSVALSCAQATGDLLTQARDIIAPQASPQVTCAGEPLYRYSGDFVQLDYDAGDGIDGVWPIVKMPKN